MGVISTSGALSGEDERSDTPPDRFTSEPSEHVIDEEARIGEQGTQLTFAPKANAISRDQFLACDIDLMCTEVDHATYLIDAGRLVPVMALSLG